MTIDLTKPLRTRFGREARFLAMLPEPHDGQPLVVAIMEDGMWSAHTYSLTGSYLGDGYGDSRLDLTTTIESDGLTP